MPHPSSATSISWKAGLTSRNSLGAAASGGPALLDGAVASSADGRVRLLMLEAIDDPRSTLRTKTNRLVDFAFSVWTSRCRISWAKKVGGAGVCTQVVDGPNDHTEKKPGSPAC